MSETCVLKGHYKSLLTPSEGVVEVRLYRYLSHGRWRGEGGAVIGDWLTRLWPSSTR